MDILRALLSFFWPASALNSADHIANIRSLTKRINRIDVKRMDLLERRARLVDARQHSREALRITRIERAKHEGGTHA